MSDKLLSIRRMTENEAVFRQHNEKVEAGLRELKQAAKGEGHNDLIPNDDLTLEFYCECADENCRQRVSISLRDYSSIHKNRNRFTVISGHVIEGLEAVVDKKTGYSVVEKFLDPPENPTRLNPTSAETV